MKKLFSISLALMLLCAGLCATCLALEPLDVDIQVSIKNGGTAVITPAENSPVPEQEKLILPDSTPSAFHVQVDRVGVFKYSIAVEPDDRNLIFDDTVYDVEVWVLAEGEELNATVVVYHHGTGKKYGSALKALTFANEEQVEEETTQKNRPQRDATQGSGPGSTRDSSRKPETILS